MKRTILTDNGLYDLDSIEACSFSDDGTAILLTMKSGVVFTLLAVSQLRDEIKNDPYFNSTALLSRVLYYLQNTIIHAAAFPEVSIDFETILEDMCDSLHPLEEAPEGEEDELPDLPYPTADVILRYLVTPCPFEEEEAPEENDEDEWPAGGDEIDDDEDMGDEDDLSDDAADDATPSKAAEEEPASHN